MWPCKMKYIWKAMSFADGLNKFVDGRIYTQAREWNP